MNRLLFAVALILAAPALAASYSATPAAPIAATRVIDRDIRWACDHGSCRGATEDSRPLVLCQGLAKRTGRLDSFTVDGRGFSAEQLAACNRWAKDGATPALAKAD